MAATTMQSITSLVKQITADFPQFQFEESEEFLWSPSKKTIYINRTSEDAMSFTLHELSHALLNHADYEKDIELLQLERDAWSYAQKTLMRQYNVTIPEETVQKNLDTYRLWLHDRSTCPTCDATGIQTKRSHYKCIVCEYEWRVNEARMCSLRRYPTTK